jgi:D-glycero-D-manno-heptose 1,7-bisphosphate phosphatase
MSPKHKVILLDRDGVLNDMVIDQEFGTIDSPLHPSQVQVFPWVSTAIKELTSAGFKLFIVTNQPSFAKGKTTKENLERVHSKILDIAQSEGGVITQSFICWHKKEDLCLCRKPKTGLLEMAIKSLVEIDLSNSWMVGDGVTDIEAGKHMQLNTAFVGSQKCDHCRVFSDMNLKPTIVVHNLGEFSRYIELLNKR